MNKAEVIDFLAGYSLAAGTGPLENEGNCRGRTRVSHFQLGSQRYPVFTNEFWTAKQRQGSPLHEISYRACFKPQLPRFFINLLTRAGEVVYDPFAGRGTTLIEAGLMGRRCLANDINPLSKILALPRLQPPAIAEVAARLAEIPIDRGLSAELDLSMFFHGATEGEIVSLKQYLTRRHQDRTEDNIDRWIRMVATNRLTGHSPGFFSVYTLPPNQAASPGRQIKINLQRQQQPEYRDTRAIILKKSKSLLRRLSPRELINLQQAGASVRFFCDDARDTPGIKPESVQLTITSPPFLDIVQYSKDNWLRCWFNGIDPALTEKKITMARTTAEWSEVMGAVFKELFRITKPRGWVGFEVGEVKRGKINLEEFVVPLGIKAGFECVAIIINQQKFTKTSNIWGINNNAVGTNSNRIVLFQKP